MYLVTVAQKSDNEGNQLLGNGRIKNAPERLEQLDSLRGIAAASVVISHVFITFPVAESLVWKKAHWLVWYSPLHVMFAGGEAVLFFFLLSGFVLSLPFYRGPMDARKFFIKRIFRIYPAYWCAITLAFACRWLVGAHHNMPDLSGWFNRIWSNPLTPGFIAHQYFLLGCFENGKLLPVVWSLVHEMRISLIFPWIMAIMLKWNWKGSVLLGFSLFLTGHVAGFLSRGVLHLNQDYTDTLLYIPIFMVGAALARYRNELVGHWRRMKRSAKFLALLGALMAYTYSWWALPLNRAMHLSHLPDMIATVSGCAIFIIASLGSNRIRRILCCSPLKTLGALSYSIFLLHALIWVLLVRLVGTTLHYGVLFVLLFLLTALASQITYQVVEQPCIRFGKRIVNPMMARK